MLLSQLIGTWRGEGKGEYPTIDSFTYTEELTFKDVGKPFLVYQQLTWSPAGAPMHTETGFLRARSPESIEFIIAQPTGQTELAEGAFSPRDDGFELRLKARIMNSATAKTVDATRRIITVTNKQLTYEFAMAAVGVPMTHHLAAHLTKID